MLLNLPNVLPLSHFGPHLQLLSDLLHLQDLLLGEDLHSFSLVEVSVRVVRTFFGGRSVVSVTAKILKNENQADN